MYIIRLLYFSVEKKYDLNTFLDIVEYVPFKYFTTRFVDQKKYIKIDYAFPLVEEVVNGLLENLFHFELNIYDILCNNNLIDGGARGQMFEKLITFQIDFMNCECKESPFCKCLEKNVSDKIIKQRLNGWNPNSISKYFISNYDIHIYPGDIFTWLDAIIRMLEAISRISIAFNNKKTSNECKMLIKKIEKGN